MRLFEYVFHKARQGWEPVDEHDDGIDEFEIDALDNSVVIDASEVMQQLSPVAFSEEEWQTWEMSKWQCTPPFIDRPIWVEGNAPHNLVYGAQVYGYRGMFRHVFKYSPAPYDEDDVGWSILLFAYSGRRRGPNITMVESSAEEPQGIVYLDHEGFMLGPPILSQSEKWVEMFNAMIFNPCLVLTLQSFHLLNQRTEVDEMTPSRAEKRQAARAFGQKGTYPLRNYYMLKVKPQKPGYTGPPQPLRQSGVGKRLHAVRGHFRRVPDTGLFGRGDKAGELLWIPNHTRGDSSIGEIVKGYKVSNDEQ